MPKPNRDARVIAAALEADAAGRRSIRAIQRAYRDPVSPCAGCSKAAHCGVGLACEAFKQYFLSGRETVAPRQPSAEIYRAIFGGPHGER
jgi:hypothetical protein